MQAQPQPQPSLSPMIMLVRRFVGDESGATVVEYAFLLAFIAMAVIIVVGLLGERLDSTFEDLVTRLG